ncbi:hypothetical protein EVAR_60574_1 [Eumeta japonica]|uniref:Uncharacterized protein n=1 Tax=Eumeta variegata TaxID=151549 RepID=A0A4C1YHF2_EUMVA|nr:hypothetical protein EVAR_60574_1 [Eumeta japonica]
MSANGPAAISADRDETPRRLVRRRGRNGFRLNALAPRGAGGCSKGGALARENGSVIHIGANEIRLTRTPRGCGAGAARALMSRCPRAGTRRPRRVIGAGVVQGLSAP